MPPIGQILAIVLSLLAFGSILVGSWWILTHVPAWVQTQVDRLVFGTQTSSNSGQRRVWVPLYAYLQGGEIVPTARMNRLYREHMEFYGAPEFVAVADRPDDPEVARPLLFACWPKDSNGLLHLTTLGMSNRPQPGSPDSIELHFAFKPDPINPQAEQVPGFLQIVGDDPFKNRKALKAGQVMRFEGIPGFPNCSNLLFLPSRLTSATAFVEDGEGSIHFLDLIPLTDQEVSLAAEQGLDALFEHFKQEGIDRN
jgi:hypothetical protein